MIVTSLLSSLEGSSIFQQPSINIPPLNLSRLLDEALLSSVPLLSAYPVSLVVPLLLPVVGLVLPSSHYLFPLPHILHGP